MISLTYDDNGSLLGSVRVDGETYIFEPAKIHFVISFSVCDFSVQNIYNSFIRMKE